MNNETMTLLERHFDAAFAAPDGIKKLRELILTLAMQGKLVPQNPNDEPASELLKAIEIKKNRLVKEGTIKQPKSLPEIKLEELPYDLPENWKWVRLGTIGELNPRNICDDDKDAGFVPMPLVFAKYGTPHKFETKKWAEIKKGYTHFADRDVALAKITPCFENGKSCVFDGLPNGIGAGTTELHIFRNTFNSVYPEYLLAYFKDPKYIILGTSKMTGSAGQKRVPTDFFMLNLFPLPPLAEQRRIVAEIDRLMARCDELEKLRADRSQKLLTVHTAALDNLLKAKESSDFSTAWHFTTQNFSELYSVKENVAELRKAILQLAVMGKLVPQDPNDEPASELLRSIELEKQRLIKEGKIKQPMSLSSIKSEELPYELPDGWAWGRLGDFGYMVGGGTPSKSNSSYWDGAIPWVSAKDMKVDYINDSQDHISEVALKNSTTKLIPERSLLIVVRGMILIHSFPVALTTSIVTINQDLKALCPYVSSIVDYLLLSTKGRKKHFLSLIERSTHGTCRLETDKLLSTILAIPPLAEQHRIVAEIDRLMGMCDRLEESIEAAKSKQIDLLNALMSQV